MLRFAVGIRSGLRLFGLVVGIAAADQLVKRAVNRFPENTVIFDMDPLFQIVRTQNSGAAFSIMNRHTLVLLILTSFMLIGLLGVVFFCKTISPESRTALAALSGGGLGNWMDRFSIGTVTDYFRLKFVNFPVFNIADIFITVSVIWLIALLLTGRFEICTGERNGTGH